MQEKSDVIDKIKSAVGKYKYAVPVIVVGLLLLLWPSGRKDSSVSVSQKKQDDALPQAQYSDAVEQKLAAILAAVEGVGRVDVFLSPGSPSLVTYAADTTVSKSTDGQQIDSAYTNRSELVITRDAQGNESAVVVSSTYPQYRGALIVCDGGNIPAVKLAVTQAVSGLLGIGTDTIIVMKMQK